MIRIGCKMYDLGAYAGENISIWLTEQVLPRFELVSEDIVLATPDNAASMLKAFRLAHIECRGCVGHSIQTMMQKALGTNKVCFGTSSPPPIYA